MAYDISAIKKKIQQLNGPTGSKPKKEFKKGIELPRWKPSLGINTVRFLPYESETGQPFQEIGFYNDPQKQLTERRIVAPCQWGMPDPVAELVEQLSKDRSNDSTWKLMKRLAIKESYFAPVLVRGQEEKGVQVWEMNATIVKNIYAILADPDNSDENLFDPDSGLDFTVEVTLTGKQFNGFDIKDYRIQPKRKESPLANTPEEAAALVDSIPDIVGFQKQFVKSEESLRECVVNFLSHKNSDEEEGTAVTHASSDDSSDDGVDAKTRKKIDDVFDDID